MKTKLFREDFEENIDDLINDWLEENDVQVKDIKVVNDNECLIALVIYQ